MRFFILDCNDQVIGNPKGYATAKGAHREAEGRHRIAIWARFDEKHKDKVNPQGDFTLYSIRTR